jgi:hypothetical protein
MNNPPGGPRSVKPPVSMTAPAPSGRGRAAGPRDSEAMVEARRQAGARLVISLYRCIKACQLYDTSNDAVQQTVPPVVAAAADYGRLFDTDVARILFTSDQVFVNRRMMRGARETFALALQLAAWIESSKVNEVSIDCNVGPSSVLALARLLVDAQRDPAIADRVTETSIPGVSLRRAVGPEAQVELDGDEAPVARVVKSYAASVLILRMFYTQLGKGSTRGANEVKRVAQKLVALSESYMELLVALAGVELSEGDTARQAVSTSVLALSMGRVLGADRTALGSLVQAALLADAGAAWHGKREPKALSTQTLGVLSLIGEYQLASLRGTVVAFEALRERRKGDDSTLLSTVLRVARRFNETRAEKPGLPPTSLDEAMGLIEAEFDGSLVTLLLRGLGLYPPGTLLELDSGELALALALPKTAMDFDRPPVELMTDRVKNMLPQRVRLDLAALPSDQKQRRAVRIVDLADARVRGTAR